MDGSQQTAGAGLSAANVNLSAGLLRQATYTTARLGTYTWLFDKVSKLPIAERRNYKNVFDSLYRICKEEGVLTMWRGCLPTIMRAMVVNAAQLATYSQAKEALLSSGYFHDNIHCHFWASMISGLATTIASMPVDIAKTRRLLKNYRHSTTIRPKKSRLTSRSRAYDVWQRVIRSEGVFALWKGFTPYYMRLGPHTVLTFVFLEQFNKLYHSSAQK
uniref:Mitochondrial 2-oxoglutarate/malate carrier protein n=1 Tax=Romanomermis culicivorax TaxID=13658 RepID=A0A915KCA3_ROMCU